MSGGYQNLNNTQMNQYFQQQQQSQETLHSNTKYISSTSIYNNNNNNNNNSSKLEIKARNYNPFENPSFSNEVSKVNSKHVLFSMNAVKNLKK